MQVSTFVIPYDCSNAAMLLLALQVQQDHTKVYSILHRIFRTGIVTRG